MAKYREKPIVINAEQWFPGKEVEGVECLWHPIVEDKYRIKTLEGWLNVSPGDYIITGIKGEKYPCKPDIFETTYERCDTDEETQGK